MEQLGPDIMFRLQLERTKKIITVVLQVKYRPTTNFTERAQVKLAIRTVTPQYFWKDKNGHVNSPKDLDIFGNTVAALRNFPDRFNDREDQYDYDSVLRGIFVFSAQNNRSTCERIKEIAVTLSDKEPDDELAKALATDPHDIFVIPIHNLLELEGPIKRGLEITLKKGEQQSRLEEEENLFAEWHQMIPYLQKADIIPKLISKPELKKVEVKDLAYQLLLHRRLEVIRHHCSGPVTYLTPHPKGLIRKHRISAIKGALDRHNQIEEGIRERRRECEDIDML